MMMGSIVCNEKMDLSMVNSYFCSFVPDNSFLLASKTFQWLKQAFGIFWSSNKIGKLQRRTLGGRVRVRHIMTTT
jgi:hypothetical protein